MTYDDVFQPFEPDAEIQHAAPVQHAAPADYFTALGYADGLYYYRPSTTGEIVALQARDHTRTNLMALAPLSWYQITYASKQGVDWNLAASSLMRSCEQRGRFSARRIRGRGGWIDAHPETRAPRTVLHLGSHLLVDGQKSELTLASKYSYQAGDDLEMYPNGTTPLDATESKQLLDLCKLIQWKDPMAGILLAGWCVVAPICGALSWRPHAWLSGPAKSGKTWLLTNIIRPALGNCMIHVVGSTTEPGIRRMLGCDALPVIFDEAETEDRNGIQRMKAIIELARQASSESGGQIAKASMGGNGSQIFAVRSMFLFASIGVAATQSADVSRILSLELRRSTHEQFRAIRDAWAATMASPEYCDRLRARTVSLMEQIARNSRVFGASVAKHLGDARLGDQMGPLLAGVYSLVAGDVVAQDAADKWVAGFDWTAFAAPALQSDEHRCLNHLLDSLVRADLQDAATLAIGELLERAFYQPVSEFRNGDTVAREQRARDATMVLKRHGINPQPDKRRFAVASSHRWLSEAYRETPWADKWKDQFARIVGATEASGVRFAGGAAHRAVWLPWGAVGGE